MQDLASLRLCACANLRSTTRIVTQFFDAALQPSSLQTTQFSLLVTLARVDAIPVSQCAQALGVDRTTLTRNLEPLIRRGLVLRTPGQDQRTRMVQMTPQGQELLSIAIPLWEQAQARVVAGLGQERFHALLGELSATVAVIRSIQRTHS